MESNINTGTIHHYGSYSGRGLSGLTGLGHNIQFILVVVKANDCFANVSGLYCAVKPENTCNSTLMSGYYGGFNILRKMQEFLLNGTDTGSVNNGVAGQTSSVQIQVVHTALFYNLNSGKSETLL